MEQRILELERKLRTTSAITWVLALLVVGLAVLTQIPLRTPQVIYVGNKNGAHARIGAEGFYLIAADGRTRAAMDLTETGPRVALLDEKGSEGGAFQLTAEGVALSLKSGSGAQIFLNAEGQATLLVDAGGGRGKLQIDASAGKTTLALDAGAQAGSVVLTAATLGATLIAGHPKVPVTAALFTTDNQAGLALGRADSPAKLAEKGTAAALVSVNADGAPAMELRTADGLQRIVAPAAAQ